MTRIQKARTIVPLTKVMHRDLLKRPSKVLVPGSEGKQYSVIVRRTTTYISTECMLCTPNGNINCEGGEKTVCYHAVAALLRCMEDSKVKAHICTTSEAAHRVHNLLHGTIFTVYSQNYHTLHTKRPLYLVTKGA